jgi:hypothetical protein
MGYHRVPNVPIRFVTTEGREVQFVFSLYVFPKASTYDILLGTGLKRFVNDFFPLFWLPWPRLQPTQLIADCKRPELYLGFMRMAHGPGRGENLAPFISRICHLIRYIFLSGVVFSGSIAPPAFTHLQ